MPWQRQRLHSSSDLAVLKQWVAPPSKSARSLVRTSKLLSLMAFKADAGRRLFNNVVASFRRSFISPDAPAPLSPSLVVVASTESLPPVFGPGSTASPLTTPVEFFSFMDFTALFSGESFTLGFEAGQSFLACPIESTSPFFS